MFVPFQRLGDTDNTTGVGLGLALSRGLAEAMGGTLEPGGDPGRRADDDPVAAGRRNPAQATAEADPAAAASARLIAGRPEREADAVGRGLEREALPAAEAHHGTDVMARVLVVDDEPQILRALRINLRARHTTCAPRPTGPEALEVAAKHPPDLVVLDLGLPGLDGLDVIEGLRGWTSAPDHRAVRPGRQHRQGGGAGRRRRRLRDQAVRHGGTAGPDAGRGPAGARGRRDAPGPARRR